MATSPTARRSPAEVPRDVVAPVAAEHLVGALAGQHHLHVAGGLGRQHGEGQRGGITGWLAVDVEEAIEGTEHAGDGHWHRPVPGAERRAFDSARGLSSISGISGNEIV